MGRSRALYVAVALIKTLPVRLCQRQHVNITRVFLGVMSPNEANLAIDDLEDNCVAVRAPDGLVNEARALPEKPLRRLIVGVDHVSVPLPSF